MEQMIYKLINLARDFSQTQTVSIYELLKQTGYSKVVYKIYEHDLYQELVKNPDLINDWLQYSENKRTDSGWYFKKVDKNKYLVGCVDKNSVAETGYEDRARACAKFIKQELNMIIKS